MTPPLLGGFSWEVLVVVENLESSDGFLIWRTTKSK